MSLGRRLSRAPGGKADQGTREEHRGGAHDVVVEPGNRSVVRNKEYRRLAGKQAPEGPGTVGAPHQERKKEDAQNRPVKIRPHTIDCFDQRSQLPRETRRRRRNNSPEECGGARDPEIVAVTRFLSEVAL